MAENPDPRPAEQTVFPVSDVPHAPFIFYEMAPALGFTNGIINITLSANRTWAGVADRSIGRIAPPLDDRVLQGAGELPLKLHARELVPSALLRESGKREEECGCDGRSDD
jgi:hypothetical protein